MGLASRIEKYFGFQQPIIWRNVIGILVLNLAAIYAIVVYVIIERKFRSLFYIYVCSMITGSSITTGAHRLWTHRTYKAKLPLRIWLMFCYMNTGMYGVVQWARDHRTHHKFADTDADPHNINRGFFFAHCGWLMMKRHPEVKEKGKLIDVSDVLADPVVQFTEKYFVPIFILNFFIIPLSLGVYVLNEPLIPCFIGIVLAKYAVLLHLVWFVNSWAHFYGYKPYNKNIEAVNNRLAACLTFGEAWHNFHHVFPWDYRIGEYGQGFQFGTYLINFYAWLGLAYDLKTAPVEMVKRVLEKNGELATNEEIPEMEINCNEDKEFNYLKEHNTKNGKVKGS